MLEFNLRTKISSTKLLSEVRIAQALGGLYFTHIFSWWNFNTNFSKQLWL